MGGLCKYLLVMFVIMWIGILVLVGMLFFFGFYFKDIIIEVV